MYMRFEREATPFLYMQRVMAHIPRDLTVASIVRLGSLAM